jgi:hypothetical protein
MAEEKAILKAKIQFSQMEAAVRHAAKIKREERR